MSGFLLPCMPDVQSGQDWLDGWDWQDDSSSVQQDEALSDAYVTFDMFK